MSLAAVSQSLSRLSLESRVDPCGIVSRLPEEMRDEIVKYLKTSELGTLRSVSKYFNAFIGNMINYKLAYNRLGQPLVVTSNNLADIINWLKNDAYVVIYARDIGGRFFHKCSQNVNTEQQVKDYLNAHKIIYINVSKMPGLLDDGEWNYYTKEAGFDECTCSLKKRTSD